MLHSYLIVDESFFEPPTVGFWICFDVDVAVDETLLSPRFMACFLPVKCCLAAMVELKDKLHKLH